MVVMTEPSIPQPAEERRRWPRLPHPIIRDEAEARRFVLRMSLLCIFGAVALDVLNKVFFFETWVEAISSWITTALIAGVISVVALKFLARAHLALYRNKTEMDLLSRTDSLTGLPNRRAFLEKAEATPAAAMVLIIADIDRFKRINDTHGHLAGDEVLRSVSRMLAEETAPLGFLGRVGGEEFAIVTSDVPAEMIVERLMSLLRRVEDTSIIIPGGVVSVTISAGVALRTPELSFNDLYAEADRALYDAKSSGRNRISLSSAFEALIPEDKRPSSAQLKGAVSSVA